MPDVFIRIVHFDPLLSNAEAEWFKDQFERIAAAYGFPIARRLPGVKPSALRTAPPATPRTPTGSAVVRCSRGS